MGHGDYRQEVFLAHSENDLGEAEPLELHLGAVARKAAEFAAPFGASDEARLCGVFHDIGKMPKAFRQRLQGGKQRVDHCSQGAWHALNLWQRHGVAAAACIWGHHQGLQHLSLDRFANLHPQRRQEACNKEGIKFEPVDFEKLRQWLDRHSLAPPESGVSVCPGGSAFDENVSAASMMDVRMLYSCLVDADFLETEAHFQAPALDKRYARPESPQLQPQRAWQCLQDHLARLRHNCHAADHVRRMRDDLFDASCRAADNAPGLFTLTAPTGTGKTLSMLAFALRHAIEHNLRRIVLVVPYLTIIEQTADVYREILEPVFGENYILEHHSLAGVKSGDKNATDGKSGEDSVDTAALRQRLLSENWDAPLVITTSVQFFESLFAHRSSVCRKLHRLADSVVMFDEAQTFPVELAVPTLAALSRLSSAYRTTIVFSTATQPAFSHLDAEVKTLGRDGWKPAEIVPESLSLFDRAKRVDVHWPAEQDGSTSWDRLVEQLAACRQTLCIVNLKRHAIELAEQLGRRVDERSLFHLSTNMCPAHREKVLDEVRRRLADDEPCLLVSTQCVEAGVDLDFPTVYRAMAPLDAIAQAAGRCNRNGRLPSADVHVFIPEEEKYPGGGYEHATRETKRLLKTGPIDINSPDTFREYFQSLYDVRDFQADELVARIRDRDFPEVAKLYRLIDNDSINILVPYDREVFDRLIEEIRNADPLTPEVIRDWTRRATPHAVSMFRPGRDDSFWNHLEPIPFSRRGEIENHEASWFEALEGSGYERQTGLSQKSENFWMA